MNNCKGLTLIELMIATVLGIMLVGGTVAIYSYTVRGSTDTVNAARLNHDLNSVLQLMGNDIRRSGFWGGAVVGVSSTSNPNTCDEGNLFTCGNTDILISNKAGEAANSCIVYAYDADLDGAKDLDEFYGFRLNGDAIEIRLTVAAEGDALNCNNGNWQQFVDTGKVRVTGLSFDASNYKCLNVSQNLSFDMSCADAVTADASNLVTGEKGVEARQIDISLQGQVLSDANVNKSLVGIVKVRNDRIFIQP